MVCGVCDKRGFICGSGKTMDRKKICSIPPVSDQDQFVSFRNPEGRLGVRFQDETHLVDIETEMTSQSNALEIRQRERSDLW
jgi:hypothetical protein